MKVNIGVVKGIKKTECEDTAFYNKSIINDNIVEYENSNIECIGVADGVGGIEGGKNASFFIASKFINNIFCDIGENDIKDFVEKINFDLIQYAATVSGQSDMATTLTCIIRSCDSFYLIHSGNTRMYITQGSYLKQLTIDQTTYAWLMECGDYESANLCNKNEITGCFGGGNTKFINQVYIQKLFDKVFPETILFTSDGIHEYVSIDNMEMALTSSMSDKDIIQYLINEATQNGSTDDKTVIIIRS